MRDAAEQAALGPDYSALLAPSSYVLADTVKQEAEGMIRRYAQIRANILSMRGGPAKVGDAIGKMLGGVPNYHDSDAIEKMAIEEASRLGLKERANPEKLKELRRAIAEKMRAISRRMESYSAVSSEQILPFRNNEHFAVLQALKKKLKPKRDDRNTENDLKIITVSACHAFEMSRPVSLYSNDAFIVNSNAAEICETVKQAKPEYAYSQAAFKIKTMA